MADANQEWLDALIRHQIYLLRFSGLVRNRIADLLNATEDDLARQIRDRLRDVQGLGTPRAVQRLNALLEVVRTIRTKAWSQINDEWVAQLNELAAKEPEFLANSVKTVVPVVLDLALPPPDLLRAIVKSRPFEGRTMREWADGIANADIARIEQQIKIGLVQGEPSADIARRIVGSARMKGVDGVTQITRRNAEAITRTAVNHVASQAKAEFYRANDDIFSEEQFVSTLDARTTPVCRANDGKRFPIGKGPKPPLHFSCRSLRVAVIDDVAMGLRPAKPVTERMLLREYTAANGLGQTLKRGSLPRGHKGSFDEFSRKRVRELTGRVPGQTTYQDWLTRQSGGFQDDVLGKTRARLFRNGGLKLDKFVNRAGDEINLHDLASLERQAFIDAGLDPDSF